MNVFQLNYDTRLKSWYNLRAEIEGTLTQNKCIEIDSWWQKAPLVNHYLHPQDTNNWPGPWDLLVENTYCTIARALGICYTLLLVDENNIEMVEATDKMGEDVVLVLVNQKYVLNYWPGSLQTNNIIDFTLKRSISTSHLINKL